MVLVLILLLEVVPDLPDCLLYSRQFQRELKAFLIRIDCLDSERLFHSEWHVSWTEAREAWQENKFLPPLRYLDGYGYNSIEAVQSLREQVRFAEMCRDTLVQQVALLPLGMRHEVSHLLTEFSCQHTIWSTFEDAALARYSYRNPLMARRKLYDLQQLVGDRLRDRNLGPMIPDLYWRSIR